MSHRTQVTLLQAMRMLNTCDQIEVEVMERHCWTDKGMAGPDQPKSCRIISLYNLCLFTAY